MLNNNAKKEDPDPHQGSASSASPFMQIFVASGEQPYARRLSVEDMELFLEMHTRVRTSLPPEKQDFMKELKPELLASLFEKNMPVIGVFEGGRLIGGCAVLYPQDPDINAYLKGYDFGEYKDRTAVVSAVCADPEQGRKGVGFIAVDFAMNLAALDGKDVYTAKVDIRNAASLALFRKFGFDTGEDQKGQAPKTRKVHPLLAL